MTESARGHPVRPQPEDLLTHGDALLRFALARVPDRQTAEDLVQETLVTAIGKTDELASPSMMRSWLIGILRHKILDHYRRRERHPGDQPTSHPDPGAEENDPWFTPLGVWRADPNAGLEVLDGERAVERSQLRAALQSCIDHLPKSLHQVFVLRELEELEPEEVCRSAGISRQSLAVFLYRARQSLRSCLQRKWVEA